MSESGTTDKYAGLTVDYIDRPKPESHPDFMMRVGWSCPRLGFGTVDFIWCGDQLHADTEGMSTAFLQRLMLLVLDQISIDE